MRRYGINYHIEYDSRVCAPDFTYLSKGLSLLDNRAKFHQSRIYFFPKCAALTLFKILNRKPIVLEQTFDKNESSRSS